MLSDGEFDALYRERWADLVRLGVLLVGGTALAEDVVQDAFVNTYRRWSRMRDLPGAAAYVRTAVVNGCRSAHRRRTVAVAAQPALHAPTTTDPTARVVDELGPLRAALAALPRRQREVIVLRYWAELSEAEIAEALGVSRGTVKASASRGRASLAAAMEVRHAG